MVLLWWVSSFRYRGKVFRVVVNAQTNEVAGDRPWSVWKIALAILAAVAVIAGIVYLVMANRPAPEPQAPIEEPAPLPQPPIEPQPPVAPQPPPVEQAPPTQPQ